MVFYDSIWQDCTCNVRITEACIVFYQGGSIDNCIHVTDPVYQSSAESDYSSVWTSVMHLPHFRMLNNEFLNKDPYMVPEQESLIILDIKSDTCMDKN